MWVDVTSYRRGDTERVSRSFQCHLQGQLRVIVTRHTDFSPDMWVLNCPPLGFHMRGLTGVDHKSAQREALALVRERLESWLQCLPPEPVFGGQDVR